MSGFGMRCRAVFLAIGFVLLSIDITYGSNKFESRTTNEAADDRRGYVFPSIMIKEDMANRFIGGQEIDGLLFVLIKKNWKMVSDRRGRICQYVSPEMTYLELQETLNFRDGDIIINADRKGGNFHASIKTDWLTCNITYANEQFDKKNKTAKLRAVVIDNEQQAYSDKHEQYLRNRSIFRRILDLFVTSPH